MNLLLGQVYLNSRPSTTEVRRTNGRDSVLWFFFGFAKQAPKIVAKNKGLDVGDLDLQSSIILWDGKVVVPEIAPDLVGDLFSRQERIVI